MNIVLLLACLISFNALHAAEASETPAASTVSSLSEETVGQRIKRRAAIAYYGQASVFCGEIATSYYDSVLVKSASLARRGERALDNACDLKNIDYVLSIMEFFEQHAQAPMNPVSLQQASRFLLDFNKRSLKALVFAATGDAALVKKATTAQQSLQ